MSEIIIGKLSLPEDLQGYVDVHPWPLIKKFRLDMLKQVTIEKATE